MKTLVAIGIGSSLVIAASAQRAGTISAPPPLPPSAAPAPAQPALPTGTTGAGAFSGTTSGVAGSSGQPVLSTPFPVVMPPGSHPVYPDPIDPLGLLHAIDLAPAPQPIPFQRRPGGLGVTITGGGDQPSGAGVTITGGDTEQPGIASPPPPLPAPTVTNTPPAAPSPAPTAAPPY